MNSLFHIYYNEKTKNNIPLEFIPLRNTDLNQNDWYELYPMLNFLNNNKLDEDQFLGFFSPKFELKTGLSGTYVVETLNNFKDSDVALFTIRWDQLAYFLNPFEQGEQAHPGITEAAQEFLDHFGYEINLKQYVTSLKTSVFANFIVAKKKYWDLWHELAQSLYSFSKNNPGAKLNRLTTHRNENIALKVFIQERLASLVLTEYPFKTVFEQSYYSPITSAYLFNDTPSTRRQLQSLDLMKEKFIETKDFSYLEIFYKLRRDMQTNSIANLF